MTHAFRAAPPPDDLFLPVHEHLVGHVENELTEKILSDADGDHRGVCDGGVKHFLAKWWPGHRPSRTFPTGARVQLWLVDHEG